MFPTKKIQYIVNIKLIGSSVICILWTPSKTIVNWKTSSKRILFSLCSLTSYISRRSCNDIVVHGLPRFRPVDRGDFERRTLAKVRYNWWAYPPGFAYVGHLKVLHHWFLRLKLMTLFLNHSFALTDFRCLIDPTVQSTVEEFFCL